MRIEEAHTQTQVAEGVATVSFDDNRAGSEALMRVQALINALESYQEETGEHDVSLRVAPLKGMSSRVSEYENAILLTREECTTLGRIVCPAVRMEVTE